GRLNLQQRLRDVVNGRNVADGASLKNVNVIERTPIDMRKRQKRKRNIFRGIQVEIVPHVCHVRAKVRVREHHAFWLPGRARSVDERSKLAGQNLRSAQTVGGNVRGAGGRNERFKAQTFGGDVFARVGHDNVFEFGETAAHGEQLLELRSAR